MEYAENHHEEELTEYEYDEFFDRLLFLHQEHRKLVAEEINREMKNGS